MKFNMHVKNIYKKKNTIQLLDFQNSYPIKRFIRSLKGFSSN